MATTYCAHIVTPDAHEYGEPEIIVMTWDAETGEAEPVANYAWDDDTEPADVLDANGWRVESGLTDAPSIGYGYYVYDVVKPADWEAIIKTVTFARRQAEVEYERQNTAWRYLIQDAMEKGASATKLAAAASISRERVYQIRDGRR